MAHPGTSSKQKFHKENRTPAPPLTKKHARPAIAGISTLSGDEENDRPAKRAKPSPPGDGPEQPAPDLATSHSHPSEPPSSLVNNPDAIESSDRAFIQKHLVELDKTHELFRIGIRSSSSIQKKVNRALHLLSRFSFGDTTARPVLIGVWGVSAVASKAISIIEITKREITKRGDKWYQYTCVDDQGGTVPPKHAKAKKEPPAATRSDASQGNPSSTTDKGRVLGSASDVSQKQEAEDNDGESDGYFETMPDRSAVAKTPTQPTPEGTNGSHERKCIRVMIFLSMVRVEHLKRKFGEQSG